MTSQLPRVIAWDEIREGDRIEVAMDDDKTRVSFIAAVCEPGCWTSPKARTHLGRAGQALASRTVRLLERKPEPLPAEAGAVILVHECGGEPLSQPVLARHVGGRSAYLWGLLSCPSCSLVWHRPEQITAWQHVEVTPVGEVIR